MIHDLHRKQVLLYIVASDNQMCTLPVWEVSAVSLKSDSEVDSDLWRTVVLTLPATVAETSTNNLNKTLYSDEFI